MLGVEPCEIAARLERAHPRRAWRGRRPLGHEVEKAWKLEDAECVGVHLTACNALSSRTRGRSLPLRQLLARDRVDRAPLGAPLELRQHLAHDGTDLRGATGDG